MANVLICDICDKRIERKTGINPRYTIQKEYADTRRYWDVCSNCFEKILALGKMEDTSDEKH